MAENIKKGPGKTSKTLEFTMEAASGFEPENVGFAGRFKHITVFYPKLSYLTNSLSIKAFIAFLADQTYLDILQKTCIFIASGGNSVGNRTLRIKAFKKK